MCVLPSVYTGGHPYRYGFNNTFFSFMKNAVTTRTMFQCKALLRENVHENVIHFCYLEGRNVEMKAFLILKLQRAHAAQAAHAAHAAQALDANFLRAARCYRTHRPPNRGSLPLPAAGLTYPHDNMGMRVRTRIACISILKYGMRVCAYPSYP